MKLNKLNPIPVTSRLKELLGDWLFITAYLFILFLLTIVFYSLVLGDIPKFSEFQSQLLAFCSSVLPLVLIFACLDYGKGSWGKRWAGLQLVYSHKSPTRSLVRSAIKFFPWQLGHMGAIRAIYQGDQLSILLSILAGILFLVFLTMGLFRKDKRHPADLLVGSQVQIKS